LTVLGERQERFTQDLAMSLRLPAALAALAFTAAAPVAALAMPVPLDHAVRLPLRGPAAEVVVGSPKYLDVTVVDPATVLVHGKELGATNVIIYDAAGRVVFSDRLSIVAPQGEQVSIYKAGQASEYLCGSSCRESAARERNPWTDLIEAAAAGAAAKAADKK
jgi:Flp pilus assembly secretin CpaC